MGRRERGGLGGPWGHDQEQALSDSSPAHHEPGGDGGVYLGLDVGGTKCGAVVGRASGELLERVHWATEAGRGPEAVIGELVCQGRALCARFGPIRRVGVAIGGPLDARTGVIQCPPHLPGWERIALAERLREAFEVPVRVEHDAAACALAEWRWGAGRGCASLAYLTCGTGFGVGLVLQGRAYYGADGQPPDIGVWPLVAAGPMARGRAGSAEAMCSGSGLPALASWCVPERWGEQGPTPQRLAALLADGDADAEAVVQANAAATGQVAARLEELLHPERILLGSLARHFGPAWVGWVQASFQRQVHREAFSGCEVVQAGLGDRLQDLSALVAATSCPPGARDAHRVS